MEIYIHCIGVFLTHMEFRKMVTMTLYARQKRDTNIKNRLLDSVGEGEGGMI